MTCISDGVLRAKLDGELSEPELLEVESHLAACSGCRERLRKVAQQAEGVEKALSALEPPVDLGSDASIALARFRARREALAPSLASRLFAKRLRPAWGVAALLVVVVGCMSFAPARSWAQKILAMLRVQKIAVVTIQPELMAANNADGRAGKMITQLLSDNVVVTMSPGAPQNASGADEASQFAGFRVRLLSVRADAPQIRVEGEQAFHMTINRDRLQAILEEVGRPDLELPASLDGATVAVHIPKVVLARYGDCPERAGNQKLPQNGDSFGTGAERDPSNCVALAQAPSPTVSVPPEVNIAEVAEVGLELAGMSADAARTFSQSVDWTSTLVIPIPRDVTSYQTVEVDGVQGKLIEVARSPRRGLPGYFLLWVKNGIIYSLAGSGNSADAVPLADSLE